MGFWYRLHLGEFKEQPLSHPRHNSVKDERVRLSQGEVGLYMMLDS